MSYDKRRPLGRFSITRQFLADDWRFVKDIMSRVVVVKCESDFISDSLRYTAFSDEFDDLQDGDEIPIYYVEMYQNADRSVHMTKFVKQ